LGLLIYCYSLYFELVSELILSIEIKKKKSGKYPTFCAFKPSTLQ